MARSTQTRQEKAQLSVTGFHHQRVVIHNKHGEKLLGILHETGSKELVIVCHGFQSSKDRIPMVSVAAALERNGISAFRFDFAGNGESEGSFQYGNYRREAEDLRAVVQYFRREERAISAIIGHSKGHQDTSLAQFISQINNLKRPSELFSAFPTYRMISTTTFYIAVTLFDYI